MPDVAIPVVDQVPPAETYSQICAACHGTKGEGRSELKSPSIAGLPSWYLLEQIEKFRVGYRGTHTEDIPGQQMRAIALSLSAEQIEEVVSVIEKLEPVVTRQTDIGAIDKGRFLFAEHCMICHKYDGTGMPEFHSAPLTSLNPEYLLRQLNYYKDGWRGKSWEDTYGHKMYRALDGIKKEQFPDLVRYIGELARGDDPRRVMVR